jgi:YYY domain-containing protein
MFLGLLAFPICFHGLKHHQDRGFTSCKLLGLVLAAFLHGCMGRMGLSPWSPVTLGLLLGPACAGWIIWLVQNRGSVLSWLRKNIFLLLKIEAGFLAMFLLGLWLAAYNPGLLGTEKLMDFAVLQSVFRADIFPPNDPWYAGQPLNYYWFGHHSTALLCRLASIMPQVGYNLMLALLLAIIFSCSCGLFLSREIRLSQSLMGASMIALAGNLSPLWDIVTQQGTFSFVPWRATRIIPNTITEFPFFSFFIGDLHAHFLLLPSFILFIIWILPAPGNKREKPNVWIAIGVLNLLFATTIWGNPWNIPVFLLVFIILKVCSVTKLPWWSLIPSLVSWPVLFEVQGHPLVLRWVADQNTSPVGPFLLMWGMPLILLALYLFSKKGSLEHVQRRWYYLLLAIPFTLQSLPGGIAITLAIFLWITADSDDGRTWHALAICGLILLVVPECVYLNDLYSSPYERLNTVFKLHYAAWVLLLSVSCYAVLRLNASLQKVSPRRGPLLLSILVMFFFVFPVLAIEERLSNGPESLTLNSFEPLEKAYPMDMELVAWLNGKIQAGDVCLELPGRSYSWSSRISALSGCPTIIGWEQHQMLWRPGSNTHDRAVDAALFYTTEDDTVRKKLLDKYKITWVIIGEQEQQIFSPFSSSFLEGVLLKMMAQGEGGIYRVDKEYTGKSENKE